MKTARDILNEMKIDERPARNGVFMTTCPDCSHKRKKKRDRCLAVKIDSLGVRWFCHHCNDFKGGQYFDGAKDTRTDWRGWARKATPQSGKRRPIGSLYR
ncbi:hypothetical protein [Bradyrhizobium sp. SZCCHNRI1002]|uniref:hypothetical protein n=1 Tax=Bradyrhizobium sp. SZCCHNRI1002 TaxID=3057274 RepID=UPI0028F15650|nr:hypothetical protein [Bradyrhizobium sp. SZCCHNRI1002]